MANTFITPDIIAREALANLYENTVMASLVSRNWENEFANKVGDTITIRKPATFVANEFTRPTGIVVQDATEDSTTLQLNHFADVSFSVTSEQLTLEINDFAEQLLNPAMEAISQKIDRDLLTLRDDITQEVNDGTYNHEGAAVTYDYTNPRVLIDAGAILDQHSVPSTDRSAVMGPFTSAQWSKDPILSQAEQRGDTVGLQEARLGARLFGFNPFMTQNIKVNTETGDANSESGIAFHKSAFTLAFRPLALPQGAQNAAIQSYKGFGLRVVKDYDIKLKQDVISIDCLYGVKTLEPTRAVRIESATNVA